MNGITNPNLSIVSYLLNRDGPKRPIFARDVLGGHLSTHREHHRYVGPRATRGILPAVPTCASRYFPEFYATKFLVVIAGFHQLTTKVPDVVAMGV